MKHHGSSSVEIFGFNGKGFIHFRKTGSEVEIVVVSRTSSKGDCCNDISEISFNSKNVKTLIT